MIPSFGLLAYKSAPLGDHLRMYAFVRVVSLEVSVLRSPVDTIKIESCPITPDLSVRANFVESGEIAVAIISFENVLSFKMVPDSDILYNVVP